MEILEKLLAQRPKHRYYSDEEYAEMGLFGKSYCPIEYDEEDEEDEW